MSCFNFRLPPANKAWKSFTTKLRSKLHNLHNRKTRKVLYKPNHMSSTGTLTFAAKPTGGAVFPSNSLLYKPNHRKSKKRGGLARALPFKRKGTRRRLHLHYSNKSCAAPVFVDKLFKEPPNYNTEMVTTHHQYCGTSSGGKSRVEVKGRGTGGEADDIWESLGFASPVMRGIDERAEEFISSFRAEMQVQERIARTNL